MKKFETFFARHGLQLDDLRMKHDGRQCNAGQLLQGVLTQSNVESDLTFGTMTDETFIQHLENTAEQIGRVGGEMLIDPIQGDLPMTDIDPYVRGIVRWMNALGIHTICSCDGHGRKAAKIHVQKYITPKQNELLSAATPAGIRVRSQGKTVTLQYLNGQQKDLLDMASNLYLIWKKPESLVTFQASHFKKLLIEMLNEPGASRNEQGFRSFLRQKVARMLDSIYTDRKGNLLGYVSCGDGPTVLLSAHMDTVEEIVEGRVILEEGTILRSSEGILGADDRAGIAVILETLSKIQKTNFNGTIKVAFTVEEEIGCLGSQKIDQDFIEDVDAAIVIDRRGKRDIVTSYADVVRFCDEKYGELFEHAGALAGMDDWKATPGGLSDARVFAEYGIPSVNLSAGYQNEHTRRETVDYQATFETAKLIEMLLHHQLIQKNNCFSKGGRIDSKSVSN